MKCKNCNCCTLGFFKYKPNDYVCIGVPEPFVISDIEHECTEYADKKAINTLLSCPFCGGKPVIESWELSPYDKTFLDADCLWAVFCNDCLSECANMLSKKEAIEAWNRRV
jgi:Lar family restriction alleviation protein